MGEYLRIKVYAVLDAANGNQDTFVANACRRLIVANRRGWRKYRKIADIDMVDAFFDACRD